MFLEQTEEFRKLRHKTGIGGTLHGMHLSNPFSVRHIKAYGEFYTHLQVTNTTKLTILSSTFLGGYTSKN
jgi:hypothetical protein